MNAANFWWLITMACLAWYCSVTVYVGVRGLWDIRNMLRRLRDMHANPTSEDADSAA
jgi:hypothetical protein